MIGLVLTADDCFTCAVPAQELRRAVTGRGDVSVRVAVPGPDVHAVQQYLRRERIPAKVEPSSEAPAFGAELAVAMRRHPIDGATPP